MNKLLQRQIQIIQKDQTMSSAQKKKAIQSLKEVDAELKEAHLKLGRTDKANRTTEKLLQSAIAELGLKRKEAEARQKELAIEAALDRVRSRAMVMYHSNELIGVIRQINTEIANLGIRVEATQLFTDFSNPKEGLNVWVAVETFPILKKFHVPNLDLPLIKNFFKVVKGGWSFYSEKFTRAEKNRTYKLLYKRSDFRFIPKERQQVTLDIPAGIVRSSAINKNSVIAFQRFGSEAFTEEENAILELFGKVFDQSYTRFLDLEKAEAQARESEIQLSLERVRAKTMAMHKSDELREVVHELFVQLNPYGLAEWGFQLRIAKEDRSGFFSWLSTPAQRVLPECYDIPTLNHWALKKYWTIYKEQRSFDTVEVAGKDKLKMDLLLFEKSELKNLPEKVKKNILSSNYVLFSVASMKYGLLEAIDVKPKGSEEIDILQRFAKVFEQTYTRFLDLQKAEAQAREAQIEAALEKVRSRTMAMHKSEELAEVVGVFYEQLKPIGVAKWGCTIMIFDEAEKSIENWFSGIVQANVPQCYYWIGQEHWVVNELWTNWRARVPLFKMHLKDAVKLDFDTYLMTKTGYAKLPDPVKNGIINEPEVYFTFASMRYGLLHADDLKPITEENSWILQRFANVFEQTYTRFLDLQKAEAQAREAEIQLALERVRARTMAMHHSDELPQVAFELFEQMHHLGFAQWGGNIALADEEKGGFHAWFSTPADRIAQAHYFVQNHGHPLMEKLWSIYKEQTELYILELRDEKKAEYTQWLFDNTSMGNMSEKDKAEILSQRYVMFSFSAMKYGLLEAISHDPMPQELNNILPRFAKVFEQTYTRFLDLKKAEAQAREAQIEAALERVRAQSMAMHKSNELQETVAILYKEIKSLGFETHACVIVLYDESNRTVTHWVSGFEKNMFPQSYSHPYFDHPYFHSQLDAWKSGIPYKVFVIEGRLKKSYDKQIFALGDMNDFPEDAKMEVSRMEKLILSDAFMKYGMLEVFSDRALDEESARTLRRFSQVFEQTYTRFLDLQKAEAQAREAQVEAALERVRAQTMAMHNSEDVGKCILKMFTELTALGVDESTRFGIGILNHDNENNQLWTAKKAGEEVKLHIGSLHMASHPLLKSAFKAWKAQVPLHKYVLEGEDLVKYYQMLNAAPDYKIQIPIEKLPEREFHYGFIFEHGFFYAFSHHEFPPDVIHIIQRFSSLFAQTYRRYLDLVKAEGQAREAQIETALEKVRSRSLAMHKSDELLDVVTTVFDRLTELELQLDAAAIFIFKEDMYEFWFATPDSTYPTGKHLPLRGAVILDDITDARENKNDFISRQLSFAEKNKFFRYIFKHSDFRSIPDDRKKFLLDCKAMSISLALEKNSGLQLNNYSGRKFSDQENDVLKRFGRVFEQAYTRFLDLQKAEAQAREAQIEAALEKIRSRSLAMRHSDELREVIGMIHIILSELKVKNDTVAIQVFDFDTKSSFFWPRNTLQTVAPKVVFPYDEQVMKENTPHRDLWEAMATGKSIINKDYTKHQKDRWLEYVFAHNDYSVVEEDSRKFLLQLENLTVCFFPERYSGVYAESWDGTKYSNEEIDVLKRAARVFEQAYVRFLDLQKAEAQAREAKIEAALEKVRARTMAMQRSDELSNVATVLFQQVKALGVPQWACGFCIWDIGDTECKWYPGSPDGEILPTLRFPLTEHPVFRIMDESRKRGDELYILEKEGELQADHYRYMKTLPGVRELLQDMLDAGHTIPTFQIDHYANFAYGNLIFITYEHFPEMHDIFKRFAKVFEQTYTRFLDLQKAEAQAREAEIELALERVRARTMAMHHSSELSEVAALLFKQLKELGAALWTAGFAICRPNNPVVEKWMSSPIEGHLFDPVFIPFNADYGEQSMYDTWKNKVELYAYVQEGDDLKNIYDHLMTLPSFQESFGEVVKRGVPLPMWQKNHVVYYKYGYLLIITVRPFDETQIFVRFAKVFEQTYTRFLDLQKAESQAREAQIEAALERVRSRSMAMHKSENLRAVVNTLYSELQSLHVNFHVACIQLLLDGSKDLHMWLSTADGLYENIIHWPYIDLPVFNEIYKARTTGEMLDFTMTESATKEFFEEYFKLEGVPQARKLAVQNVKLIDFAGAYQELTGIFLMRYTEGSFSPHEKEIIKRFSKVFEQTYTRFLDLQKAEAQAREAQIEASLERVRAKAMAMHSSQDLVDTINVFYHQMGSLSVMPIRCGIGIADKETHSAELSTMNTTDQQNSIEVIGKLRMSGHPVLEKIFENWLTQTEYHPILLDNEINKYYDLMRTQVAFPIYPNDFIQCGHFFYFSEGWVYAWTNTELKEDELRIYRRFTSVLSLTYKRYKDLKQAEAQAREAQIEAALERVRSRSMAMQHSSELNEILKTMFGELSSLGLALARCVIWIFNAQDRSARWWAANPESESGTESFLIPYTDHPTCNEYWKSWEEGRARFFYELSGETKRTWDDYLFNHTEMARLPEPVIAAMKAPEKVLLYNSFRDFGVLFAVSLETIGEENFDIIERFGKVFDQSYTRFNDIRLAEAREKEAVKQSSLDRVRADIASMRTTKDLDRITPLIWKELSTLNIPFVRCGVFIMDDSLRQIHTFLSTPDGRAIAAFHLPYDVPGRTSEILANWMMKREYIEHWDETAFSDLGDLLVQQGSLPSKDAYLKTVPKGGIHLHCLPFLQGMLYVGNTEKLKTDDIQLIQSVADAFSTAYARYEDFNKLEVAKQQVDKTLIDLKQAQQQLVQSEKMASLGELTAGVAHEIQNPLNFVNNFSELNAELVNELEAAVETGDLEEVKSLVKDIKANEEKIGHHGKRADGIVKSMLQHSQTSSGQSEMTDINTLCEEYLRLAYHGYRAKDKSFNVKFETDFDRSLPKINVVTQDIGRVILNLINNAFYAVNEKEKLKASGYEPRILVSTRNLGDKIEIKVKDNGNGIPENVKEKIFQPFFTTKPTGQGTGLGLSLAYDIVTKGHGGELKVESRAGSGSEFIISLPL